MIQRICHCTMAKPRAAAFSQRHLEVGIRSARSTCRTGTCLVKALASTTIEHSYSRVVIPRWHVRRRLCRSSQKVRASISSRPRVKRCVSEWWSNLNFCLVTLIPEPTKNDVNTDKKERSESSVKASNLSVSEQSQQTPAPVKKGRWTSAFVAVWHLRCYSRSWWSILDGHVIVVHGSLLARLVGCWIKQNVFMEWPPTGLPLFLLCLHYQKENPIPW